MNSNLRILVLTCVCLVVIFSGCMQQKQIVCPDQTVVDDISKCDQSHPEQEQKSEEITLTTTNKETTTTTTTTTTTNKETTTTIPTTTIKKETTTTIPTTTTTIAPEVDEVVIRNEDFLTKSYAHVFFVPAVFEESDVLDMDFTVTNNKNSTFHFHLLNDNQTADCKEAKNWFKCINGIIDVHAIRSLYRSFQVKGNWSFTIKNVDEGAEYNITWRVKNPSKKAVNLWSIWNEDLGGCLYYQNNGTICDILDFRKCYRENLGVCKTRCCRLTDYEHGNRTWYRECMSMTDYEKMYHDKPLNYKFQNEIYLWLNTKYFDSTCKDPYRYSK